ncbi:DUF1499 domain-containing protein [Nitrospira sp. BLG_2]|uniref:DUF1499 domain-containing protein n=1 Tax=Nitrospira sp. BLG_2 TaxID=3397507 RepID=UPI003B9B7030
MRLLRKLLVLSVAVPIALTAAFFLIGPERVWEQFGPADLGPVAFETLKRRDAPNDALACPTGVCRAQSDLTPPEYAVDAAKLRAAFAKAISAELRITAVATDATTMIDRYIQRSALMRYPDTIVVQFFDRPGGRSTLALYSRSQLGHGDMGVNRARLERWLAKLGEIAPVVE